MNNQCWYWWN